MELILKIELTKLTDKAKILLMDFISESDPKGLMTKTDSNITIDNKHTTEKVESEKIEIVVNPISKKPRSAKASDKILDHSIQLSPISDKIPNHLITLENIREKVIALRDAGKKNQTLEVMKQYKISKLSELDPDEYAPFVNSLNSL